MKNKSSKAESPYLVHKRQGPVDLKGITGPACGDGKRFQQGALGGSAHAGAKRHIEHAARIKGTSVSDFVVLSADDAAIRAIREQKVLVLNERAREVFAQALLNPPAPGGRLATAAQRYKDGMKT